MFPISEPSYVQHVFLKKKSFKIHNNIYNPTRAIFRHNGTDDRTDKTTYGHTQYNSMNGPSLCDTQAHRRDHTHLLHIPIAMGYTLPQTGPHTNNCNKGTIHHYGMQ
jgi:hypothetical protein